MILNSRVTGVRTHASGFHIDTGAGAMFANNVVLASGGQSFPKTGSDGSGYGLAKALGHTLIPTTPALAPLILEGDFHVPLSGISHFVELAVQAVGWKPIRTRGVLLWTHFGASGPVVLDISRHWHRARQEQREVALFANLVPGEDANSIEGKLLALASAQPRLQLHNALERLLPARFADAILDAKSVRKETLMAHLSRPVRRNVVDALVRWPLPVRDSRGYAHAEATAGGIPLAEVNAGTLVSRMCPGLYLAGEILDVDGRIGGFNFQWAWASAWVVATALQRARKSKALMEP
jgi:hypothetical protein